MSSDTACASARATGAMLYVVTMLIYGAAGFVGTALTAQLTRQHADRVILIDQRAVPDPMCRNLMDKGIEVMTYRASTLHLLDLPPKIDTAVVLAGQTNVDEALCYPPRAIEKNIQVAVEAGEWLRSQPQARLFYLSTDEVLGESSVPLPENAPHQPTQPYAVSKAAAEMVLRCYCNTYSLNIVMIRACNLVGAHQRAPKLIPIAVTHLVRGEEVPVFGSGRQAREWLAVEDLCNAVLALVGSEIPRGIYNCSSGVSLTVLEVIRLVAKAVNAKPYFRYVPDRIVQDRFYAMSCMPLRSLGWSPQQGVDDAIVSAARAMKHALITGECLLVSNAPMEDT